MTSLSPASPSASSPGRLVELDVLRAIAILLVLGHHMLWLPDASGDAWLLMLHAWRRIGWIGVDLFFVLSGFLVGGLLIREALERGHIQPGRFLIRRGLRIYPPFYTFLIASVIAGYAGILHYPSWPKGIWGEAFFIQNYDAALWPQTWSLAVEEHFYIVLLIGIYALVRWRAGEDNDPFQKLPRLILVINGVIFLGRIIAGYGAGVDPMRLLFQSHWRLDALLMGVVLAYGMQRHPDCLESLRERLRPWRVVGLTILFLPCVLFNVRKSLFLTTIGLTANYLAFGWIVLDLIQSRILTQSRWIKWFAVFPWIGRHSYSIYLWHFMVYYMAFAYVHRILRWTPPSFLESILYVSIAILWGAFMAWAIETPVSWWRNRRFPSPVLSQRS